MAMTLNKIERLSDLDHVRKRPAMYVGTPFSDLIRNRWVLGASDQFLIEPREINQGLNKLFDEIISNSIDEAFRTDFRFANKIDVGYDTKLRKITVTDNGRGIPLRLDPKTGRPEASIAVSELRSGTNFNDHVEAVSIGTHGLGATLVNLLSSEFELITADGKQQYHLKFASMMRQLVEEKLQPRKGTPGTSISWIPAFGDVFGEEARKIEFWEGPLFLAIRKRLFDLSVCFPQIQFSLNGQPLSKTNTFSSYVQLYSADEPVLVYEHGNLRLGVFYREGGGHATFVNGIETYEGGTHLEYVRDQICDRLVEKLGSKAKKIGLRSSDLKNSLCFVMIVMNLKQPKFRSQTKEYISNSLESIKETLGEIPNSLIALLAKAEDVLMPIFELKQLKNEHLENVQAKKLQKKAQKATIPDYIPANGRPAQCVLYITEGKSASGMLTQVRNPEIHGCFPLRGKPLNTYGLKPVEILENRELANLMSVLNLKFGDSSFAEADMAYGTIRIMADADQDGYHIISLLLAFFSHWPFLFTENRIRIVRCPIIMVKTSKGQKVPQAFYSFAEYQKFLKGNPTILESKYFKGLGSLSENEYEKMVNTPVEHRVSKLTDLDRASLKIAFGEDADARKVWMLANGK